MPGLLHDCLKAACLIYCNILSQGLDVARVQEINLSRLQICGREITISVVRHVTNQASSNKRCLPYAGLATHENGHFGSERTNNQPISIIQS